MESLPTPQMIEEKMPALAARYRVARKTRKERERTCVLIVEDQLFSRKMLQEILRADYDIAAAETAAEGMRLFFENAPEIALLDIELADKSGHALARLIKGYAPDTHVVMVTANNSAEDVRAARANKVDGFIVKPYSKGKVLDCIKAFYALHPDRKPKEEKP